MRVALLTNFIPPYRRPLYEEIQNRCSDFRIFLSTITEEGRTWKPEWGKLPIRLQQSISIQRLWRHPNRFAEFQTVHCPYDTLPQLISFRPDVIVSGEMGMRTLQAAIYRCLNPRSRLIIWATLSEVTEHGRGFWRRYLRHVLLRSARAVLVNGRSGARYVHQFGISPTKTFLVPYTTDLQPFLATSIVRSPESRHRMLHVGALTERKGILPFLNHLARWAEAHSAQRVELHLAGSGPLRNSIETFRRPSNLKIQYLGHISYDRLPDLYSEYGLLAFPTLADEWGMVVTEAMASGVPVLGSLYSQAVEELVEDGENGWTFRPDRPEEIDSALNRALTTPHERMDRMARYARARVCGITPAVVAEKIMSAVHYAMGTAC